MPDWSYHPLFKPILHRLPPPYGREFIHRGMSTISSTPAGEALIEFLGHMAPSKKLKKQIFDIEFASPVGLSGKIDPQLTGLKAFQHLGFGFIEIGPVSIHGSGHKDGLYLDQKQQRIQDTADFSIKLSTVKDKLQSLKKKKVPLFIKVSGSYQEIQKICVELLPYSDGFILHGHAFNSAEQFKQWHATLNKPVIFSGENLADFENLKEYHPDGVLLETGDSIKRVVDSLTAIRKVFGSDVPIITSGGIREPADAVALLENGASLVMLGYEYIFTGPGLPKRINEAYSFRIPQESVNIKGWLWYWLFGLVMAIAGFIALIVSMTAIVLPYDESFLGIMRRDILEFNPAILYFMAHDRMTLSGTMVSGGILFMQLARHGIRRGLHWARKAVNTAGIIGFLGFFLFIGYGYFDWLHGLLWLFLLPLFVMGFAKSKHAAESPSSSNLFNTRCWKLSLYGQLSLVLLGFALTIGGIVISTIGATNVFVPTDLTYLCLTPEMMNEFNEQLIPVIAHDRAGFGSALLCVGLLVLMLALWGIREGERWVWWTFTIGAIPAFLSGIITHFVIGYTDFIHLLPAYFAVILYLVGIICTAPFLLKKQKSNPT